MNPNSHSLAHKGLFVLLALLLAGGAFVAIAPPTAAASGGPVVLMGIDAEDGGVDGHGPIEVYEDVVTSILAEVSNGGSGVLVIGGGKDPDDDVTAFWDQIASDLSITVTYVNAANISSQSFAGFAMLAVVSSEEETSSGGLTEEENDALAARGPDIATFINSGGGLLGFSQSGLEAPYAYLGGIGGFTVEIDLSYEDIIPTADGLAVGVTDDLDVCCWHDTYTTFPSFLKVLATVGEDEENAGEAAALGGAQVVVSSGQPAPRLRTATPTASPTLSPTQTPVPPTATPTAPAPSPTAAVAGVVVSPPSGIVSPPRTGLKGTSRSENVFLPLFLVSAGAVALTGLAVAYRRRAHR